MTDDTIIEYGSEVKGIIMTNQAFLNTYRAFRTARGYGCFLIDGKLFIGPVTDRARRYMVNEEKIIEYMHGIIITKSLWNVN